MPCSIAAEKVFGPRVAASCVNGFDFTLLFEESILTIAPISIVCLILPIRVWRLQGIPVQARKSWLYTVKLVALSVYMVLHLVLLALWGSGQAPRTAATIPCTVVSVVAFIVFFYVSHLEHLRSLRPSTVLNVYLGISLILDIARARTLWLIINNQVVAACFSASCALKAVVLVLEATEKQSLLIDRSKASAKEATSGIYSRSLFWWLNSLLWNGCKSLLTVDTLTALDHALTAPSVPQSLLRRWNKGECHATFTSAV